MLAICPLCDSARISALAGYERAHLHRCHECSFVFAGRRPSAEQIRAQYDGYGLGDVDSPITRSRYEELLDGFETYRRTNRMLDIGCGQGRFLEVAQNRGWEVHGTESTEGALERNRAKGIAMTLAPVKRGDLPAGAFDVACAFEVVEHLADPKTEAATLADAVREGGLLYVTTPNFDSLSRRLLRADWNIIEYPEHLGYFTAASLSAWLRGAGFTLLELTTTGTSPRRLAQGLRRRRSQAAASSPPPAALDDERVREAIESSRMLQAVKRLLNAALDAVGSGDTLKARFERRGTG